MGSFLILQEWKKKVSATIQGFFMFSPELKTLSFNYSPNVYYSNLSLRRFGVCTYELLASDSILIFLK